MHEQPPAKDADAVVGKIIWHLAKRMIDGECRFRYDVLIIHIRGHSNDSARPFAHADEIHDWICPHDVTVQGILAREHPLRDTLADDHHWLAAALVIIVEVPAFDHGHAESREKSRRNRTELRQRVFFPSTFNMAFAA